eukprot:SAG31_NODE_4356_length_3316_cov_1.302145_2_plen_150_part_00
MYGHELLQCLPCWSIELRALELHVQGFIVDKTTDFCVYLEVVFENGLDEVLVAALASLGLPKSAQLAFPATVGAPVPEMFVWAQRLHSIHTSTDSTAAERQLREFALVRTPLPILILPLMVWRHKPKPAVDSSSLKIYTVDAAGAACAT